MERLLSLLALSLKVKPRLALHRQSFIERRRYIHEFREKGFFLFEMGTAFAAKLDLGGEKKTVNFFNR